MYDCYTHTHTHTHTGPQLILCQHCSVAWVTIINTVVWHRVGVQTLRPARYCSLGVAHYQYNTAQALLVHNSRLSNLSVCLSVRKVYCGKTADCIRMPLGVVSGIGRGTGVLDGGGDRQRDGAVLGVNFKRPIATNGDGDVLFPNYFGVLGWTS